MPIEDFADYDKLIFVTDLRSEDTSDLTSLKAQLERIAAVSGLNVELVVINKDVPAELQSWLVEKKITLTQYIP